VQLNVGWRGCQRAKELPMPAPLRIMLTPEEERTAELRVAPKLAQRIKDCAHMLRLNARKQTATTA